MKPKNNVNNMVDCLQVVKIYSFMKEIKLYVTASYVVFLLLSREIISLY